MNPVPAYRDTSEQDEVLSQQLPHKDLCRHPIPKPHKRTQGYNTTEKQGCTVSPTSLHSTRTLLHYDYFENFVLVAILPL